MDQSTSAETEETHQQIDDWASNEIIEKYLPHQLQRLSDELHQKFTEVEQALNARDIPLATKLVEEVKQAYAASPEELSHFYMHCIYHAGTKRIHNLWPLMFQMFNDLKAIHANALAEIPTPIWFRVAKTLSWMRGKDAHDTIRQWVTVFQPLLPREVFVNLYAFALSRAGWMRETERLFVELKQRNPELLTVPLFKLLFSAYSNTKTRTEYPLLMFQELIARYKFETISRSTMVFALHSLSCSTSGFFTLQAAMNRLEKEMDTDPTLLAVYLEAWAAHVVERNIEYSATPMQLWTRYLTTFEPQSQLLSASNSAEPVTSEQYLSKFKPGEWYYDSRVYYINKIRSAYLRILLAFKRFSEAETLLVDWRKHPVAGVRPGYAVYHDFFTAFYNAGKKKQAWALYEQLVSGSVKGYQFNSMGAVVLMNPLAEKGDEEGCLRILNDMKQLELPFNSSALNILMKCARNAEDPARVEDTFRRYMQQGVTRDMYSYNTLLSMYAESGDLKSAMKVFNEMKANPDVKPSYFTYHLMMQASARSDTPVVWAKFYQEMIKSGVAPTTYTFGIVTELLYKQKDINGILNLCKTIKEHNTRINTFIFDIFCKLSLEASDAALLTRLFKLSVNELGLTLLPSHHIKCLLFVFAKCGDAAGAEEAFHILADNSMLAPTIPFIARVFVLCARAPQVLADLNTIEDLIANKPKAIQLLNQLVRLNVITTEESYLLQAGKHERLSRGQDANPRFQQNQRSQGTAAATTTPAADSTSSATQNQSEAAKPETTTTTTAAAAADATAEEIVKPKRGRKKKQVEAPKE